MVTALLLQLLLLAFFSWIAVRWVTGPLTRLAEAADTLGPDLTGSPMAETGSTEVVRAARAFNSMQRRIVDHLKERMQILAAISHDLQTPITRMRLRADLLDDAELRDKLHGDLNAMQLLVEDGIAYARDGQGVTEAPCKIDLDALLDSLVDDYVSAGRALRLTGRYGEPFTTRPNALRRVVVNLIDNALKFGKSAEVALEQAVGGVSIQVLDRGPGIPPSEMQAVLQPFYRVEGSRNRETGGSGLGLAIAQQLTTALGGTLTLTNRPAGGLQARIFLPALTPGRRRRQ
jgi:signal transduction histidine kinase